MFDESDIIIKELELRNFMCFQAVNLKLKNRCTFVCGPINSGKSAVLEAVEFITTKKFINESAAKHLLRDDTEEGYVKIVFNFTDDENDVENVSATRFLSQLDTVFLDQNGNYAEISFDLFHMNFKLNSDVFKNFFSAEFDWNNLDSMNLLHFFKFKTFFMDEESYILAVAKDLQKRESFSFIEKLYIEEEILEMLWYSKHFDHERLINSEIKIEQLICPARNLEAETWNNIDCGLLHLDVSQVLLNENILSVENALHLETKQIDVLYDEYRKIIGLVKSYVQLMNITDEFYVTFMENFHDAQNSIRQLVYQSVASLQEDNEIYKEGLLEKLEEIPLIKAKQKLDEFILCAENNQRQKKVAYNNFRRTFARLNRKFHRKQRKQENFLEFLENFKKKFEDKLEYDQSQLPDEIFGAKLALIHHDQLWIEKESLFKLKTAVNSCFSTETLEVIDYIFELNQVHDVTTVGVAVKFPKKEPIVFVLHFDSEIDKMLPSIKFTKKDEVDQCKVRLNQLSTSIVFQCYDINHSEIKCSLEKDYLIKDQYVLFILLEEWLIVVENKLMESPNFVYKEYPNKVLVGGYRNVRRFDIYKQYLSARRYMDSEIRRELYYEQMENKFTFLPDMWDHQYGPQIEKKLSQKFKENNILCANICSLGNEILNVQQRMFVSFQEYHFQNALLKLLRRVWTIPSKPKMCVSYEDFIDIHVELNKEKFLFVQNTKLFLSYLGENHFSSFLWNLKKAVLELQLKTSYDVVILYEAFLHRSIEDQSMLTDYLFEIRGDIEDMNILDEDFKNVKKEQEEFLRQKHFPLDYDPNRLDWSPYEGSLYEKYKNLGFIEISQRLKDARDFIEYYKNKYKLNQVPDRKKMRMILTNCQHLLELKIALEKRRQRSSWDIFQKFCEKIQSIFRKISLLNVSVKFYIEHDENVLDENMEFLEDAPFNAITIIDDGEEEYSWTAMERKLRFLLLLSTYLAGAHQFQKKVLCVENCNLEDVFLTDFREHTPQGTYQELSGEDYLQNVVNFCNEKNVTMFIECRDFVNVQNCNVVYCQLGDTAADCKVIDT